MVEHIAKHYFIISKHLKVKMSMFLDIKRHFYSSEQKQHTLMTERSNIRRMKNNFVTANEQG